ncbi:MAG: hypothetical protein WBC51_26510, partial [Vicinamibacterales bacterium]
MNPILLRAASATFVVVAAVTVVGCYGRNDVTAPDDLMLLTALPTEIPADGFSTTTITAKLATRVDRELLISFTASAGTIATTPFSPNSNGEVSTLLKSTTVPQSVLVTANVKRGDTVEASRTLTVTFQPVDTSRVIRLALSSMELEADGASSIQIRAEANPSLSPRTVKFETTNGSFSPNTETRVLSDVPTGADGIARSLLYAPRQIGTALVTVSAGGFSAAETVRFVRARPDAISLRATPLALPQSETQFTKVIAKLSRALGQVTQETRV